jgi:hypothetical protein
MDNERNNPTTNSRLNTEEKPSISPSDVDQNKD